LKSYELRNQIQKIIYNYINKLSEGEVKNIMLRYQYDLTEDLMNFFATKPPKQKIVIERVVKELENHIDSIKRQYRLNDVKFQKSKKLSRTYDLFIKINKDKLSSKLTYIILDNKEILKNPIRLLSNEYVLRDLESPIYGIFLWKHTLIKRLSKIVEEVIQTEHDFIELRRRVEKIFVISLCRIFLDQLVEYLALIIKRKNYPAFYFSNKSYILNPYYDFKVNEKIEALSKEFPEENIHNIEKKILSELLREEDQKNKIILILMAGRLRLKGLENKLLDILNNENNPDIKSACLYAMNLIGGERLPEYSLKFINDESNAVRYFAIAGLSKVSDEKAIQHLILGVNDKNEFIANTSIEYLNNLDKKFVFEKCIELINSGDLKSKIAAIKTINELKRIRKDKKIEFLKPLLHEDENEEVRIIVFKILTKLNCFEPKDYVNFAKSDPCGEIRRLAIAEFVEFFNEDLIPVLKELLNDGDRKVVSQVIKVMDVVGISEYEDNLVKDAKKRLTGSGG
jgi:hypothetical protein